jgi:hypothetical protein
MCRAHWLHPHHGDQALCNDPIFTHAYTHTHIRTDDIVHPRICAEASGHSAGNDNGVLCNDHKASAEVAPPPVNTPTFVANLEQPPRLQASSNIASLLQQNDEYLIKEAISAAVRQDAKDESANALSIPIDHASESTAIVSAMRQLIRSEGEALRQQASGGERCLCLVICLRVDSSRPCV